MGNEVKNKGEIVVAQLSDKDVINNLEVEVSELMLQKKELTGKIAELQSENMKLTQALKDYDELKRVHQDKENELSSMISSYNTLYNAYQEVRNKHFDVMEFSLMKIKELDNLIKSNS